MPYFITSKTKAIARGRRPQGRICLNRDHHLARGLVAWYPLGQEIDGHDFHERTKDQAKRDKSRDRYLTAEGFRIFRYTGSEIYNDSGKAIREVANYLVTEARKHLLKENRNS